MNHPALLLPGAPGRRSCRPRPALLAALGTGLLLTLGLGLPAGGARAQVPGGTVVQTFEPGSNLSGVSGVGDFSVQAPGSPNTLGGNGTGEALLTTFNAANDGSNVSGTDAVGAVSLANRFGIDPGLLASGTASATEGSGLFLNVSLSAGQTVSFDYSFLTAEPVGTSGAQPDFAFVTLAPVDAQGRLLAAPSYHFLTGTATGGFSTIADPLGQSPFSFVKSATGVSLFPGVATAGSYVVGFGVVDANTFDTASGLAIDNVTVTGPVATPEPGTLAWWAAAGGTLLGGAALRRRWREPAAAGIV